MKKAPVDHYSLTRKMYDQVAITKKGFYDAYYTGKLKHSSYQKAIRKKTLIAISRCPSGNTLEIGCGNGDFLIELARKFPDRNFTGIDFAEEQIKLAKLNSKGINNIEFKSGSALDLKFPDNSYELVLCINVLHHIRWEDQKSLLTKITQISSEHIIIEIKNKNNFYYKYLRTGFGKHTANFDFNGEKINVYPTTIPALTTNFNNDMFTGNLSYLC